jgi:hypothetical protein
MSETEYEKLFLAETPDWLIALTPDGKVIPASKFFFRSSFWMASFPHPEGFR